MSNFKASNKTRSKYCSSLDDLGNARKVEELAKPEIVNVADDRGAYTPLHHAALKGKQMHPTTCPENIKFDWRFVILGNVAIATALLRNGANVNARTSNGKTPLQKATEKNHPEIVNVLIQYKADVNAVHSENR